MRSRILLLLILAGFLIHPFKGKAQAVNVQDSLALVDLYDSTSGPGWLNQTNWLTKSPLRTWYGIYLNNDGTIWRISLRLNGLKGKIPPSTGSFKKLFQLDLGHNQLSDTIPSQIGDLGTSLVDFYLDMNQLTGNIPSSLGNLTGVEQFQLNMNQLSGNIPSSLGNLVNAKLLWLDENQLSGNIPSSLGNLANLQNLTLSGNKLNGEIPSSFGNLSNLIYLNLQDNHLSDSIPLSLITLNNLRTFYIRSNYYTYNSLEFLVNHNDFAIFAPQDTILPLHYNNGRLSVTAGGAVSHNTYTWHTVPDYSVGTTISGDSTYTPRVSGKYKVSVSNSVAVFMGLSSETISVTIPPATLDSFTLVDLYNSTNGAGWQFQSNWLSSKPVSTWYGITTDITTQRVIGIDLSFNHMDGVIPTTIYNLTELTKLNVTGNNISGPIPYGIETLTKLTYLGLAGNKFTGSIPAVIGDLTQLDTLYLGGNNFQGGIPPELGNLSNLVFLNLNVGTLTGNIPVTLGNLSKLTYFACDFNKLTGNIPASLGNLLQLQYLILAGNNFTGTIPDELGNLSKLTYLQLSGNQLTGPLPASLNNFAHLTTFDISSNKFTFDGLEGLHGAYPLIMYFPQDTVLPLQYNAGLLHISVGGNINNNTYTWFKNGVQIASLRGDSTYTPKDTGTYWATITNSVLPRLTLYSDTLDLSLTQLAPFVRDSLVLVNLYNNTNGSGWVNNKNWLTKAPVNMWYGISTDDNGISRIILESNNLVGTVPPLLGYLSNLKVLRLSSNVLSDTLPALLGKLSNLQVMGFYNNLLSGQIPASFGNLHSLTLLDLESNHLSGNIQPALGDMLSLQMLFLSHNQLQGNIPVTLTKLVNMYDMELEDNQLSGDLSFLRSDRNDYMVLDGLDISNNAFTFAGLEHLVRKLASMYLYAPQAHIHLRQINNNLFVSAGGNPANNTYHWYRNDTLIATNIGDSTLQFFSQGRYSVNVTNAVLTQLTLYSDTLATSSNDSLILPAKPNTEYASYEYTDTAGWTHYYYNNNTPNDLSDDTLLLSLKKNGQSIGTIGDGTFAVKLVATNGAGSNAAIKLTNPLITNSSGYWVMNRYWQVTATHEPTASVGVRFYYNNQDLKDVNGSYPTHDLTNDKLIFYKAVGGNPDPTSNLAGATKIISIMPGTVASDTSWTYHQLSDTTQYGEYNVASFSGGGGGGTGNNKALPVTLISFNGNLIKNDVLLNWQTASEINANSYTIERSIDGISFKGIGEVKATGNSTVTQSYNYTDFNVAQLNISSLYYRLKISDKDGRYSYSGVIKIKLNDASTLLSTYPNPVHNTFTLAFNSDAVTNYSVQVTDINGRLIKSVTGSSVQGMNRITIDVHNLAQGSYLVTLIDKTNVARSLKFIKQ